MDERVAIQRQLYQCGKRNQQSGIRGESANFDIQFSLYPRQKFVDWVERQFYGKGDISGKAGRHSAAILYYARILQKDLNISFVQFRGAPMHQQKPDRFIFLNLLNLEPNLYQCAEYWSDR